MCCVCPFVVERDKGVICVLSDRMGYPVVWEWGGESWAGGSASTATCVSLSVC